jgi:hypothetical protein
MPITMKIKRKKNSLIVLTLLLSACDSPTGPQVYPEAESPSAQLFQTKCSGCHVAPQPGTHVAQVWPGVLHRMQMRMKAKGVTPLDNAELGEILDYLQRHAATQAQTTEVK